MSKFTLFTIFGLILSLGPVPRADGLDLAGHWPADDGHLTALGRAIALDPLASTKLRKSVPNSLVLATGSQMDASCVAMARSMGVTDPAQLRRSLDKTMARIADKTLKCRQAYPELGTYLGQWISQFRRQVFKCETDRIGSDEGEFAASSDMEGTITLSKGSFKKLLNLDNNEDNYLESQSTVLHELLHSTKCNNRHDHNHIEAVPASYESDRNTCRDNSTLDRVSVVESLCSGDKLNSSDANARLVLAKRMNLCGTDRGCRSMFTSAGNNITFFNGSSIPNEDLSNDAATRLCQRIKDDGMCLHLRITQGPTITRSRPQVIQLKAAMEAKMRKLIPSSTNHLPLEIWDQFPELKSEFEALKDTPCFRTQFRPAPAGGYYAIRTQGRFIENNLFEFSAIGSGNIETHLSQIVDNLQSTSANFNTCKNDAQNTDRLVAVMGKLKKSLKARDYNIQLHAMLIWMTGRDEFSFYPEDDDKRKPDSKFAKLLGSQLHSQWVNTMDRFHHESPNFDCVAAGISPFRIMEGATGSPPSNQEDVCTP